MAGEPQDKRTQFDVEVEWRYEDLLDYARRRLKEWPVPKTHQQGDRRIVTRFAAEEAVSAAIADLLETGAYTACPSGDEAQAFLRQTVAYRIQREFKARTQARHRFRDLPSPRDDKWDDEPEAKQQALTEPRRGRGPHFQGEALDAGDAHVRVTPARRRHELESQRSAFRDFWRASETPYIPERGYVPDLALIATAARFVGGRSVQDLAQFDPSLPFQGDQQGLGPPAPAPGLPARKLELVRATLPGPREGRVWPASDVRTAFENAVVDAQLDDLHFHDLRHHFASWYIMRGGSLPALQQILGHADIK